MTALVSFVVGLVFALGLGISQMTHPSRVIGFLDFFGTWDPTLVFVMGGAVLMYTLFYRVLRGARPVFANRFDVPAAGRIDRRLILGSILFGLGWGLAGFCPGPALVSLASASRPVFLFVGAMVLGMVLFAAVDRFFARARRIDG